MLTLAYLDKKTRTTYRALLDRHGVTYWDDGLFLHFELGGSLHLMRALAEVVDVVRVRVRPTVCA